LSGASVERAVSTAPEQENSNGLYTAVRKRALSRASVERAVSTAPEQENNSNGLEEKAIQTEGRKPLLDTFQLVGTLNV
jgi:hypothetical protein